MTTRLAPGGQTDSRRCRTGVPRVYYRAQVILVCTCPYTTQGTPPLLHTVTLRCMTVTNSSRSNTSGRPPTSGKSPS